MGVTCHRHRSPTCPWSQHSDGWRDIVRLSKCVTTPIMFSTSHGSGRQPALSRNENGVSGWAWSDCQLIRLHVCANVACPARDPASKYFPNPHPRHARLIEPGTLASAAEGATAVVLLAPAAGSGSASSGANEVHHAASAEPATAAPEAPAVAGPVAEPSEASLFDVVVAEPSAEPPEASPPDVVVAGPPSILDSAAAACPGPDEQSAGSKLAEKSQVSPPPPAAPKLTMAAHVPPPMRATLLPMAAAAPCPPVTAPVALQKQTIETPAVDGVSGCR